MSTYEIITNIETLPVYFAVYSSNTKLIPSHWHKHIEVLFILEGRLEIVTNNETYLLSKGDMFVINPSLMHLTRVKESSTIMLLQIPFDYLKQSIKEIDSIHFNDYFDGDRLKNNASYIQIIKLLNTLIEIYDKKDVGYSFLFQSTLNQFLYHLYKDHSIKDPISAIKLSNSSRDHLQKAIDYMQEKYNEHLRLSDISTYLSLNKAYFCRLFKKNIGFTFLEYLNHIRLTHIYNDLIDTNLTIMVIIEKHGLSNYKVFSRLFKETYDCTPSELRKTIRKK